MAITDINANEIFNPDQNHLWENEMVRINPQYKVWTNMPSDIMNN